MTKLSKENSEKAAKPIREMMKLALMLDITYLSLALEKMRDTHNTRDAAAILNPHPFIHNESQYLNAAKLDQLDLLIQLGQNAKRILELTVNLKKAKDNEHDMNKMFNI
jgi:hypothetical protein